MTDPHLPGPQDERDIAALKDAERARKTRGFTIIAAALILAAALIAGLIALTDGRQGPALPVEQAAIEDAAATNDPTCRAVIDAVTQHGDTWRALDVRLVPEAFSQDTSKAPAVIAELEALRMSLDAEEQKSAKAVLRYDNSRAELDAWFDHIDQNLQLLIWLARSHNNPAPPPAPFKIREPERTPEQMRTAAVASIHDDFEHFRVWHTSGMHPCGAAPAAPAPAPAAP